MPPSTEFQTESLLSQAKNYACKGLTHLAINCLKQAEVPASSSGEDISGRIQAIESCLKPDLSALAEIDEELKGKKEEPSYLDNPPK